MQLLQLIAAVAMQPFKSDSVAAASLQLLQLTIYIPNYLKSWRVKITESEFLKKLGFFFILPVFFKLMTV